MNSPTFMTRRFKNMLLIVVLGAFNLLAFNNCTRKPELTNRSIASATYVHLLTDTDCLSCHTNRRPTTPVGPSYTFDHTSTQFGGQNQCSECHTQAGWVGGVYSHAPIPTTCLNCHTAQRPLVDVVTATYTFSHNLNGMGDCVGCHGATTTAYNVISDWAGANVMPADLKGNKSLNINIGTPTWANTTISLVTSSSTAFPLQMKHSSSQVAPGVIPALVYTCANCHAGASSANPDYTTGIFHASITNAAITQPTLGITQPTACIDCHINAAPTGFVGVAGIGRTPVSASMRHDAVVWNSDSNGNWSSSTTKIVTQECTICHTTASAGVAGTWASSNATYHAKLTAAGIAQPSSCLDCHANSRPTGPTGATNFVHSNAGGLGDCMTCHQTNVAVNNYTSWTNTGYFGHTAITSCTSCHSANRPVDTSSWTQTTWTSASTTFDLTSHASGTDCYSCHSSTLTGGVFTSMANWNGGVFSHSPKPSSCVNCHSYPTASTPDLTGSGLTLTDHSGFGGQDCLGCHFSPPNYTSISGWGGASATPAGLVNGTGFLWNNWSVSVGTLAYTTGAMLSTAKVTNATVSIKQQMLHSSSQIPAGIKNTCTTCHAAGMITNNGTQFHTHVAASAITSCNSCHSDSIVATTAPIFTGLNGIVGPLGVVSATNQPNMNHFAKYASASTIVAAQDCAVCHTATVGTSWKDGVFHAKIGTNTINTCTACHIKRMPTTLVTLATQAFPTVDKFSHTSKYITQDCVSCHLASKAGPTGTWVTTVKLHSIVPATAFTECKSCHNTTPNPDLWAPAASKLHQKGDHPGLDCFSCHNNTLNANSIGNNWIRSTAKSSQPCLQCH